MPNVLLNITTRATKTCMRGVRVVEARASDSELTGPAFDYHWRHRVVSLSNLLLRLLVNT